MSVKKHCPLLEASEALNEYIDAFNHRQKVKRDKLIAESEAVKDKLYGRKDREYCIQKAYGEFCTNLKDELLGDAIKSIYISALRENVDLTDNGIFLANNIVENFIKESGGADNVIRKMKGKTYALDFIVSVVEGTYESVLEDVDKKDPESFESSEEKKEEMFNDLSKDGDITNAVNIIAKRVTDAEEEFIKKNNEDKEALKDIADKFSERIRKVEDDEDNTSESPESEEEIPDSSDTDMDEETPDSDDDETQDDTETEEEIPDSDEEDSTDENKTSIKNDSKPGDDEKNDNDEAAKQESVLLTKAINDRRTKRQRNVLEQVVINFTESVLKNDFLKEEYIRDGRIDMGSIVESSKCIYGFLETVNTLQIHKVDSNYIEEALINM